MKRAAILVCSVLVFFCVSFLSVEQAQTQTVTYTAIAGKKPKDPKAKNITFVACRSDNQLGKYVGPKKDVGAAKFKGVLTNVAAKKLIKPPTKKSSIAAIAAALVKGKVPFASKKTVAALEAEIDACGAKTATSTGTWLDVQRNTMGNMQLTVAVNATTRVASFTVDAGGSPLGLVDTTNLPPETQSFTVPAGQNSAPVNFDSAFIPGNVAGSVSINETEGTFTLEGTVTHSQAAGSFAGTTATLYATGPLSGATLGAVSISGNFPAGNNDYSINISPPTP